MEQSKQEIWPKPDDNSQFLVGVGKNPFRKIFDPSKLPVLEREPQPSDFVYRKPPEWFLYDSWNMEYACKLIVWGELWTVNPNNETYSYEQREMFALMMRTFQRAMAIAESSVKAGKIKEHDTPANWIDWAESKGYSVVHLMPASDHPFIKFDSTRGYFPPMLPIKNTDTVDGAPHLKKGRNDRKKIESWVAWQAVNKVKEGDKISDLAGRIKLEADKCGYESERKNKEGLYALTVLNITKMIPEGTTGGRAKNTGKPKKRIGAPIQF